MLRTFGLVAVHISASAAFAAVIARPLYAVVINPPIVFSAQAAPGVTTQGETYQNVTFSISNADPVDEGGTLVFQINRQGYDGQAHDVGFEYPDGTALLIEPLQLMRFEANDSSPKRLSIGTVLGPPGDGNHDIRIQLRTMDDGAFIGEAGLASATIRDVPPAAYSIVPDGDFTRGNDLLFTVARTNRFDPLRLAFQIIQDEAASAPGEIPDFVEFAQNAASVPLLVPPGRYDPCKGPVTVALDDGATTSAVVNFSDPPAAECSMPLPPPPPIPPPRPPWLDYLPLIIGGIALASAAVLDKVLKPFVKVHPSCTVTPGAAAFRPLEQPVSRWPEIKADVTIIPGECSVTQPLPRSEQADG